MKRPRVTEDPIAVQQSRQEAKQAAGVGIPPVPKPPVKQRAQTLKEKMEALQKGIADQRIGPAVSSDIVAVVQKKAGVLKPKKTNFDQVEKQQKKVEEIVKRQQDLHRDRSAADAIAEADQLGTLLGSVQKELHPQHREAIEARAQQLKDLVRNVPTIEDHLNRGLKVQNEIRALRQRREEAGAANAERARSMISRHYGPPPRARAPSRVRSEAPPPAAPRGRPRSAYAGSV